MLQGCTDTRKNRRAGSYGHGEWFTQATCDIPGLCLNFPIMKLQNEPNAPSTRLERQMQYDRRVSTPSLCILSVQSTLTTRMCGLHLPALPSVVDEKSFSSQVGEAVQHCKVRSVESVPVT